MFFQPLLETEKPYKIGIAGFADFPLHLHHEIELLYCIEGSVKVRNNGQIYTLSQGEFIIIQSMVAHETIANGHGTNLLIELSPVFLRKDFKKLSEANFYPGTYSLNNSDDYAKLLKPLFDEICAEHTNPSAATDLIISGDIYKICACLIRDIPKSDTKKSSQSAAFSAIKNILEMVYYHYNEPISIEYAANICGYGKSNFCKIFSKTVGESFHSYLNNFRISQSEILLTETKMSIEEISSAVGFSDAKTFCRVFKSRNGITPGQYRRSK